MKTTHNLEEVLMDLMYNSEWARNSDYALYADYIASVRPDIKSSDYYEVMRHHKDYGIYSFKAVERARRAIQAEARKVGDLSLLSDKQVQKWRKTNEQEYRTKYSKGCDEE
ncbi:MAG: hypothetical protein IJX99_01035 [Clostridia bacterium]|nr:hypothetical protein [Clostridia bacterium]